MTPTEQDNELRVLLDEFVLYTDSSPESNEPTELKLFLEQCDFPDAIDRLYSELMQLIAADRKRVAIEARIDERSIYISDHINGKNSAFIACVKNAVEHEHLFDRNSLSCKCGVSKIFMVDAADEIAELKAQQEANQ